MKIHQLSFKNINNLKGEHVIPFNELPLSQAGIFAIVGPTGSGKSSILDVITLALFNRIPRFKKAISKNEIANEGSVITHHTTEAFATIDYEIKGLKYRSTWSMSTNRNGKLKDYEMTLFNPDGKAADLKKSEVPLQNEKIIGLNYDQFIKSILLSQGEFSKFLKADKNERGKLLEKITGTSIYREIGVKAYQKHKEVKEKLELEREKIGVISTLSDEDRNEIAKQQEEASDKKKTIDSKLNKDLELKQVKLEIQSLNKSLSQKQSEGEVINKQVSDFKVNLQKLDIHQKLNPLQGSLTSYNIAIETAQRSKENLKQYKSKLEQARQSYESAIQEMSTLTKTEVNADTFKKVMNDFETEINNADRDLENLKKNGQEARARINTKLNVHPTLLGTHVKPQEAVLILTNRRTDIDTILTKANIDSAVSPSEHKRQLKESHEELRSLKKVEDHFKQIEELGLIFVDLNKELESFNKEKENKTPLVLKSEEVLQISSQKIELLFKQKGDALKIAKLEDLRNELTSNEPCPLCGSTEHPYSEHKPDSYTNEIEENIKATQNEIDSQRSEIDKLKGELIKITTSINLTQKLIFETQEKVIGKQGEIKNLVSNSDKPDTYKQNAISNSIETLGSKIETKETAIDALSELSINKDLAQQYKQLNSFIEDYKSLQKNRESKFDGKNINDHTNKLQDKFEASKNEISSLSSFIKKDSEVLEQNNALVQTITNDLLPKIQGLGFSTISEIKQHMLDESAFNSLSQEKSRLDKTLTKIETEIKTLTDDLKIKLPLDTKTDISLDALLLIVNEQTQQTNHFQEIIIRNSEKIKRDDEDRKKVKAKEKAISKLSQELEKWALLNKMIGDAQGNKFSNFAQGLTLQNLLVYANRRLTNLSDRYLLDKPENDGALIVIDKYQGNTSRSVTTLSGGESFLISLALALSLSDMASKNVALDCLFIDEGFGTLDPDSLESALNTLEKLQSESQKTVGVISHVEALKERIDVQIKLNKNAQGYSQIEVMTNDG